jgi:N-acetylmuramoyl-L-alanine amidase
VSFHRNSSENPGSATGAQVLVYSPGGEKERLANNIQNNLVDLGFRDLGIDNRPNLVVLRRTQMPAVLVETGFLNNEADNEKFDKEFDRIAQAIADGIIATANRAVPATNGTADPYEGLYEQEKEEVKKSNGCTCDILYRVQVGAFRNRESAERLLYPLNDLGFPAFIIYQDGLYKVQVGAYRNLDNAVSMEQKLKRYRYNTYITT